MKFSHIDTIFDPLLGRVVKRWVLELPGAGCQWYKDTGGCTMCGFNRSTQKFTFGGRLFPHWIFMIIFWYAYWLIRKFQPEQLVIYNGGSFLNDKEIPPSIQLAIMRFVRYNRTIQKIIVETRAEFVISKKLSLYREALSDKQLEIAIGLESANDCIRNDCLRKGMSRKVFEKAVALCREFNILTFAYVFLKPENLSDSEAVEDAVTTIKYCFDKGVDEVSLSCAFVQEGTPLHKRYLAGAFQPPTLWSIIEVIRRTVHSLPVRIGSFDDDPPPIATPDSCSFCHDRVMSAIGQYRQSHDPHVFDDLGCQCRNQ